ncbi:MAG: caspase family protein, partial [Bacteroidota bacterium]
MSRTLRTLLIGIDHYAYIRDLGGCKSDVQKVHDYLLEVASHGDFEPDIFQLTDQDATRSAVISALENHLIKPAQSGDVCLIYFSGHGAQEEAGDLFAKVEYDGKLEGWVCHDTGPESDHGRLLADKELRYLLGQLAKTEAEVIFISDSCHAGDNHRSAQQGDEPDSGTAMRRTGITLPARPYQDFVFAAQMDESTFRQKPISETLPEGRMVSLAAC